MDELAPASRSGYSSLPSSRACGHAPHSGAFHFEPVASLAHSVVFGTMGRDTPTPVRGRSVSVSSSRLEDRSRSPLPRRPPSGQRCTLTPRTTCRLREAPRTGTPRSQRQRAPSPCRVKCESPRDPEKRHRAWLRGDSLASPVPPPFGEVKSGEFAPSHAADLTAAAPARRSTQSEGYSFSMRWDYYSIRWEEASEGRLLP